MRVQRHTGGSVLTIIHITGYESGAGLTYSFNATDRLVALSISVGGC